MREAEVGEKMNVGMSSMSSKVKEFIKGQSADEKIVEDATVGTLEGPDWSDNFEACDMISTEKETPGLLHRFTSTSMRAQIRRQNKWRWLMQRSSSSHLEAQRQSKTNEIGMHQTSAKPAVPVSMLHDHVILPMSGNPFFTCILSRAQVERPFLMEVPEDFCELLPNAPVHITVSFNEKDWRMRYLGAFSRKLTRWKEFAQKNGLRVGDACVFELVVQLKGIIFRVQILNGQIPDELAELGSCSTFPCIVD